jgi:hypothetical protein
MVSVALLNAGGRAMFVLEILQERRMFAMWVTRHHDVWKLRLHSSE